MTTNDDNDIDTEPQEHSYPLIAPPPNWLTIICPVCAAMPGDECRSPNGDRVRTGAHVGRVNADRRERGLIRENTTK